MENCTLSRKFSDWLLNQLEIRGWTQRELSRRAVYSASAISKVVSDHVKPTFEFCEAMSRALGVDITEVLEQADLLETPPGRGNSRIEKINRLLKQLPDDKLAAIEDYITYTLDKYRAEKGQADPPSGAAVLKKVESRIDILKSTESMSQEEIANLLLYLSERLRSGGQRQNNDAQTPAILAAQ